MFKRGYVFIFYFILILFPLLFSACSSGSNSSSVGTIYEDSDPNIVISGINVPGSYIELTKSQDSVLYYDISAVAEPSNAVNKTLLYSSSDSNIATVDDRGVLTVTDFGEFSVKVQSEANSGIWQQVHFYVAEKILTPVDIEAIPLSIFGEYSISQYGINKTPNTNVSGSLTIDADKSGEEAVVLGLVFNGAVIDMTATGEEASMATYDAMASEVIRILNIKNNADSNADIVVTFKGEEFPALVESGLITSNDELQLSLKKENDINVGQQNIEPVPVAVTSVTLAGDKEIDRKDESSFVITPLIKPSNATDKAVTYVTSNSDVATVSETGLVTLHKAGDVQIEAIAASNEEVKDVMSLKVTDSTIPVSSIVRNTSENNVLVGSTISVAGVAMPEEATHRTITYISLNPDIATVESTTGEVKGIKKGTAKILAFSDAGNYKEEYDITVEAFAFPVTAIMNVPSIYYISMADSINIAPVAFPEYAYDKTLKYEVTSGSDVISFDEASSKITPLKEGQAELTISSADDTVKKSMSIYVREEVEAVDVSSITLNNPPSDLYINYTTFDLVAETNADANINTVLSIETSDSSVLGAYAATDADNKWQLTPLAEGTSEVKVYSTSGVEQKFTVTVHKVMNTKGYYKLNKVDYSYNGVSRTFYPNGENGNDNLQGEFGINVDDAKILFHGRLQLKPHNPLDKASYTFNNWRFIYVNKEIALDSNDIYAKQIKQGYINEGLNITGEKTIEYVYTENGFKAHLYLEKASDVYTAIEDKTIYMTDIDVVNDPHSLEGYYEMTWFYGNSRTVDRSSWNPERYQPLFSNLPEERPTSSDIGITYLDNNQTCWGITCWGGNGENGSVTNYTGAFAVKVDGTGENAKISLITKVQMQGHHDFNTESKRKYIHGKFDALNMLQNKSYNNFSLIDKNLNVNLTTGSGSEGSKSAFLAYRLLNDNNMQFEMQFLTTYQFMYRAVKVSDRYIDLPTAKYVDGDVTGRTPPEKPSQVEIKPIAEVTGSASNIY